MAGFDILSIVLNIGIVIFQRADRQSDFDTRVPKSLAKPSCNEDKANLTKLLEAQFLHFL